MEDAEIDDFLTIEKIAGGGDQGGHDQELQPAAGVASGQRAADAAEEDKQSGEDGYGGLESRRSL